MEDQYYIRDKGKVSGPFPVSKLRAMVKGKKFSRSHHISLDKTTWIQATELPEARDMFSPQERPPKPAPPGENTMSLGGGQQAPIPQDPIKVVDPSGEEEFDGMEPAPAPYAAPQAPQPWYYSVNNQSMGPVEYDQLSAMVWTGQLRPNDLVWKEGMANWTEAREMFSDFPAAPAAHPAPMPQSSEQNSSLAVASFVLGLLGTNIFFFIGSVVAIILGHIARGQLADHPASATSRGLAFAGLILGYGVVVATFLFVIGLMFYALLRPPTA